MLVSLAMKRSGYFPDVRAAFDKMAAAAPEVGRGVAQSPLATLYPQVNWVSLFAKVGDLVSRDYDWSADFAKMSTPTMLVFADADAQTPEHIVEYWRLLGGGQRDSGYDGSLRPTARLAVVPGTTQYNILGSDVVARLTVPFLDEPLAGSR